MDKKSVDNKIIVKDIIKEKVPEKKPVKVKMPNPPKKNPEIDNI
jgi:hypothetical protein